MSSDCGIAPNPGISGCNAQDGQVTKFLFSKDKKNLSFEDLSSNDAMDLLLKDADPKLRIYPIEVTVDMTVTPGEAIVQDGNVGSKIQLAFKGTMWMGTIAANDALAQQLTKLSGQKGYVYLVSERGAIRGNIDASREKLEMLEVFAVARKLDATATTASMVEITFVLTNSAQSQFNAQGFGFYPDSALVTTPGDVVFNPFSFDGLITTYLKKVAFTANLIDFTLESYARTPITGAVLADFALTDSNSVVTLTGVLTEVNEGHYQFVPGSALAAETYTFKVATPDINTLGIEGANTISAVIS